MMVHLSVWAAWLLIALTIVGAGTIVYLALGIIGSALNRVQEVLRDRMAPLLEDNDELKPLPPERSWEQMTSGKLLWGPGTNREPLPLLGSRQAMAHYRKLEAERKRAFRPVERKIRAAYASLGLDGTGFTRAMAAQVRELTP